jgi:arginine deiminase
MNHSPSRLSLARSRAAAATALLLLTSCGGPGPGPSGLEGFEPEAPYVVHDADRLDAVLVSPLGEYLFRSSEMGSGHPFFAMGLPRQVIEEHEALVNLLRREGVRVITVREALDSAVANARSEGALEPWLRETFPATAGRAVARMEEIDGASLLNMRAEHFYIENEEGHIDPLFPGMSSIYWTRDFAAMTPKGVIIGNSENGNRALEKNLARLMFGYADGLRTIPVVLDAAEEGISLDGGDIIVWSGTELLLGVGNRSSRAAAPLLARRLGMDVYAVQMPPSERRSGLQRQLLHLDSIFNLVADDVAVAVPFFLERDLGGDNPMGRILLGIADQMERLRASGSGMRGDPGYRAGDPESVRRTVEIMPEVGWVTRYAAGTGEEEALELELVDLMRERGYTVVYVGGERGDLPLEAWTLERAMYELRWQGANVVQIQPGTVAALHQNLYTNAALRAAGIEVLDFPGQSLSMRNGGPHCLLMPLTRLP